MKRRPSFSEREGIKPKRTKLQVESMDDALRNRLWNVFKILIADKLNYERNCMKVGFINIFCAILWDHYFGLPLDTLPQFPANLDKVYSHIRETFFNCEWNEVYDFLDFIANIDQYMPHISSRPIDLNAFMNACDYVLEEEMAGYKFLNGLIRPITDKTEIKEIQEALKKSSELGLEGVKTHLDTALTMLSDRKKPNFRKSIDESILAVESLCRKITGNPKAKLGEALNQIEKEGKIEIHTALKQAYSKIYGFASDAAGIRHGWSDELTPDFADAKYMLVSCSAFINYLILKTAKAGIKF